MIRSRVSSPAPSASRCRLAAALLLGAILHAGRIRIGPRLVGLLGSDVLSQFGSVTVDYEGERLLLRHCAPRPAGGG